MIVDLFAGPGGADEGLRMIGATDVLGIEWDSDACATAEAAGHKRVQADVSQLDPHDYKCEGLWASPPCQAWSMAGKRAAMADQGRLFRHVMQCRSGWVPYDPTDYADARTPLVLEPLRWIDPLRPDWVAFEQVPPVLEFWKACAYVLREWGYQTWVDVLNAADYGVPQTRRRAILMAYRRRPVGPPEQTHAEVPTSDLEPWVTMAQALGWDAHLRPGETEGRNRREVGPNEPAPTLCFGHDAASWVVTGGETTERYQRRNPETQPAPPVTGAGNTYYQRPHERPATTVLNDSRIGRPEGHMSEGSVRVTVEQAAILQGFPADYPWHGSKTSKFQQVGNAVPPPLAAAVCSRLTEVIPPTTPSTRTRTV